jgi:hypothetical protein
MKTYFWKIVLPDGSYLFVQADLPSQKSADNWIFWYCSFIGECVVEFEGYEDLSQFCP